jgi:hypothetical protein
MGRAAVRLLASPAFSLFWASLKKPQTRLANLSLSSTRRVPRTRQPLPWPAKLIE